MFFLLLACAETATSDVPGDTSDGGHASTDSGSGRDSDSDSDSGGDSAGDTAEDGAGDSGPDSGSAEDSAADSAGDSGAEPPAEMTGTLTVLHAVEWDGVVEEDCALYYTATLTANTSEACPDCEYSFDIAYTYEAASSYDDGSCLALSWAPPQADFSDLMSWNLDTFHAYPYAAGTWSGGLTYYGYVSSRGGYAVGGTNRTYTFDTEIVYYTSYDPYGGTHTWSTEVYHEGYYTGYFLLVFE